MDWQTLIVLLLVLSATAYLVRAGWRTWIKGKAGCGSGCHSTQQGSKAEVPDITIIPAENLTLRRR